MIFYFGRKLAMRNALWSLHHEAGEWEAEELRHVWADSQPQDAPIEDFPGKTVKDFEGLVIYRLKSNISPRQVQA